VSLDAEMVGEDSQLAKFAGTRHESPEAFAARVRAWAMKWRCLGPSCHEPTPMGMFCSDRCREASREFERGKRR
jgi:hypothetical protein